MTNDAQKTAEATVELIEKLYFEKESISDLIDEISLGDVRFEVSLNTKKQPFPFEFCSGKVMVTYGGPTTWLQSNGEVVSYWGAEEGHCLLTYDMRDEIQSYFEELYSMMTGE